MMPIGRRFLRQCKIVHEKAEATIKERKQELAARKLRSDESPTSKRKRKYLDFLDILIEAKVLYVLIHV